MLVSAVLFFSVILRCAVSLVVRSVWLSKVPIVMILVLLQLLVVGSINKTKLYFDLTFFRYSWAATHSLTLRTLLSWVFHESGQKEQVFTHVKRKWAWTMLGQTVSLPQLLESRKEESAKRTAESWVLRVPQLAEWDRHTHTHPKTHRDWAYRDPPRLSPSRPTQTEPIEPHRDLRRSTETRWDWACCALTILLDYKEGLRFV